MEESQYTYHYRNHEDLSYYVFENIYYQTTPNKWLYYSENNQNLNLPKIYFSPVEKTEFLK